MNIITIPEVLIRIEDDNTSNGVKWLNQRIAEMGSDARSMALHMRSKAWKTKNGKMFQYANWKIKNKVEFAYEVGDYAQRMRKEVSFLALAQYNEANRQWDTVKSFMADQPLKKQQEVYNLMFAPVIAIIDSLLSEGWKAE